MRRKFIASFITGTNVLMRRKADACDMVARIIIIRLIMIVMQTINVIVRIYISTCVYPDVVCVVQLTAILARKVGAGR